MWIYFVLFIINVFFSINFFIKVILTDLQAKIGFTFFQINFSLMPFPLSFCGSFASSILPALVFIPFFLLFLTLLQR